MRTRLIVAAVSSVGLAVLGSALLFTGSTVSCEEVDDGAPALRCAFNVAVSPEEVWQAFTTTDEPRRHYFDAVLEAEPRPGGRWRFVTGDRERLLAGGEILAFEPPRRLDQTFRAADLDEPASRITIRIEPTPNGSWVSLVHHEFATRTTTYRRFRKAHPLALSALKASLETGELPIRARIYTFLFKPGMNLVKARAEPWDG